MFYLNDYKGKWYVIGDESDDMYGDIGTIESHELTDDFLLQHAINCEHYGIPMYTGKDKDLNARCREAFEKVYGEQGQPI